MEAVDEKYYTVEEIAERLRVTRRTVSRWIDEGDLVAVKLSPGRGGHVRIAESDLREFLEQRRTRKEP